GAAREVLDPGAVPEQERALEAVGDGPGRRPPLEEGDAEAEVRLADLADLAERVEELVLLGVVAEEARHVAQVAVADLERVTGRVTPADAEVALLDLALAGIDSRGEPRPERAHRLGRAVEEDLAEARLREVVRAEEREVREQPRRAVLEPRAEDLVA